MRKKILSGIFPLFVCLVLFACQPNVVDMQSDTRTPVATNINNILPTETFSQPGLVVEMKPTVENFPTATALPNPVATPTLLPTPNQSSPTIEDYLAYGYDLIYQGDLNNAIQIFNQVLTVDPNNVQGYNGRGLAYEAQGDLDRAIADYSMAILYDPLFADAYNNRGEMLFLQENRDRALVDFSTAIELDPTFGLAYQNRALVQRDFGKPDAAIVDLQVYLALVPDAGDREIVEELLDELAFETRFFASDLDGRLYAQDFEDPSAGGWYGNGEGLGFAYHDEGGFRITIPASDTGVWAYNTYWVSDMRLETDVKLLGGSEDNMFGVLCRFQDNNNFYALVISSDGFYGIGKRVDGGALEPAGGGLGQLRYSSVIKTGSAVNHISTECVGETLRLWVNGSLLLELNDPSIVSGMSGVFVYLYSGNTTDVLFDNFEIYEH